MLQVLKGFLGELPIKCVPMAVDIQKYVAVILTLSLGMTQVVLAHQPEKSFWESRRAASTGRDEKNLLLASLPAPNRTTALATPTFHSFKSKSGAPLKNKIVEGEPPSEVGLKVRLSRYGNVQQIQTGPSAGPFVLHVQDIHGQRSAQENIAGLISSVLKDHPDSEILLEGAPAKPLSLNPFRTSSLAATAETGWFFFNTGYITGAELPAFTAKAPPLYHGLEDPRLYVRHVTAVKDALAQQPAWRLRLQEWAAAVDREKKATYSPTLMELDQKVLAYRDGRLPLGDFARFLGGANNFVLNASSPQFGRFLKTLEWEKTIDFHRVEVERNRLLSTLLNRLPPEEVQGLLRQGAALRSSEISFTDFYTDLRTIARRAGLFQKGYAELNRYVDYLSLAKGLSANELLNEMAALERRRWAERTLSSAQADLHRADVQLTLLKKLVNLSLTPSEWDEYLAWKQIPRSALADRFDGQMEGLNLSVFERFYELATARDGAMAESVRLRLAKKSPSTKIIVVVAGGFHSKGLARELKGKGTLLSVIPKLGAVPEGETTDSLSVFTRDDLPLDRLFASPKIALVETSALSPIGRSKPAVTNLSGPLAETIAKSLETKGPASVVTQEATIIAAPLAKNRSDPSGDRTLLVSGQGKKTSISIYKNNRRTSIEESFYQGLAAWRRFVMRYLPILNGARAMGKQRRYPPPARQLPLSEVQAILRANSSRIMVFQLFDGNTGKVVFLAGTIKNCVQAKGPFQWMRLEFDALYPKIALDAWERFFAPIDGQDGKPAPPVRGVLGLSDSRKDVILGENMSVLSVNPYATDEISEEDSFSDSRGWDIASQVTRFTAIPSVSSPGTELAENPKTQAIRGPSMLRIETRDGERLFVDPFGKTLSGFSLIREDQWIGGDFELRQTGGVFGPYHPISAPDGDNGLMDFDVNLRGGKTPFRLKNVHHIRLSSGEDSPVQDWFEYKQVNREWYYKKHSAIPRGSLVAVIQFTPQGGLTQCVITPEGRYYMMGLVNEPSLDVLKESLLFIGSRPERNPSRLGAAFFRMTYLWRGFPVVEEVYIQGVRGPMRESLSIFNVRVLPNGDFDILTPHGLHRLARTDGETIIPQKSSGTGGSWLGHPFYKKWFSWVETPLSFWLGLELAGAIASPLASFFGWEAAATSFFLTVIFPPLLFWAPHPLLSMTRWGNPKSVADPFVLKLTYLSALAAVFSGGAYLADPWVGYPLLLVSFVLLGWTTWTHYQREWPNRKLTRIPQNKKHRAWIETSLSLLLGNKTARKPSSLTTWGWVMFAVAVILTAMGLIPQESFAGLAGLGALGTLAPSGGQPSDRPMVLHQVNHIRSLLRDLSTALDQLNPIAVKEARKRLSESGKKRDPWENEIRGDDWQEQAAYLALRFERGLIEWVQSIEYAKNESVDEGRLYFLIEWHGERLLKIKDHLNSKSDSMNQAIESTSRIDAIINSGSQIMGTIINNTSVALDANPSMDRQIRDFLNYSAIFSRGEIFPNLRTHDQVGYLFEILEWCLSGGKNPWNFQDDDFQRSWIDYQNRQGKMSQSDSDASLSLDHYRLYVLTFQTEIKMRLAPLISAWKKSHPQASEWLRDEIGKIEDYDVLKYFSQMRGGELTQEDDIPESKEVVLRLTNLWRKMTGNSKATPRFVDLRLFLLLFVDPADILRRIAAVGSPAQPVSPSAVSPEAQRILFHLRAAPGAFIPWNDIKAGIKKAPGNTLVVIFKSENKVCIAAGVVERVAIAPQRYKWARIVLGERDDALAAVESAMFKSKESQEEIQLINDAATPDIILNASSQVIGFKIIETARGPKMNEPLHRSRESTWSITDVQGDLVDQRPIPRPKSPETMGVLFKGFPDIEGWNSLTEWGNSLSGFRVNESGMVVSPLFKLHQITVSFRKVEDQNRWAPLRLTIGLQGSTNDIYMVPSIHHLRISNGETPEMDSWYRINTESGASTMLGSKPIPKGSLICLTESPWTGFLSQTIVTPNLEWYLITHPIHPTRLKDLEAALLSAGVKPTEVRNIDGPKPLLKTYSWRGFPILQITRVDLQGNPIPENLDHGVTILNAFPLPEGGFKLATPEGFFFLREKPSAGTAGAWFGNRAYKKNWAWVETPLSLLLGILGVGLLPGFDLLETSLIGSGISGALSFWLPHLVFALFPFGNPGSFRDPAVIRLTAQTFFVAALFPIMGLWTWVLGILLTRHHFRINNSLQELEPAAVTRYAMEGEKIISNFAAIEEFSPFQSLLHNIGPVRSGVSDGFDPVRRAGELRFMAQLAVIKNEVDRRAAQRETENLFDIGERLGYSKADITRAAGVVNPRFRLTPGRRFRRVLWPSISARAELGNSQGIPCLNLGPLKDTGPGAEITRANLRRFMDASDNKKALVLRVDPTMANPAESAKALLAKEGIVVLPKNVRLVLVWGKKISRASLRNALVATWGEDVHIGPFKTATADGMDSSLAEFIEWLLENLGARPYSEKSDGHIWREEVFRSQA